MRFININHLPAISRQFGFIILLIFPVLIGSCKKEELPEGNPAIIQVFNALEDGQSIRANLSGSHPIKYLTALTLRVREYAKIYSVLPVQPVAFYATADTMPDDAPVWKGDVQLERGKIYTMFLVNGTKGGETVFFKQEFPAIPKDSVTFLGFANMSHGQSLSVNIKGQPHGSLISKLDFKEVSPYLQLPADKSVSNYVFELRDVTSGTLLTEFSANSINNYSFNNNWLHKTHIIVLTGKPGGTGVNKQAATDFPIL